MVDRFGGAPSRGGVSLREPVSSPAQPHSNGERHEQATPKTLETHRSKHSCTPGVIAPKVVPRV